MAKRVMCMMAVVSGSLMLTCLYAGKAIQSSSHAKQAVRSVQHYGPFQPLESMFAELPLENIDRQLIAVVTELTYGQTPEQVINELVYFYGHTAVPLLTAAKALERQKDYVDAALKVAQLMLAMVPPNDAPRSAEVQEWIDDLNTLLSCIEDVLVVLKDNPKLVAMLLKNGQ